MEPIKKRRDCSISQGLPRDESPGGRDSLSQAEPPGPDVLGPNPQAALRLAQAAGLLGHAGFTPGLVTDRDSDAGRPWPPNPPAGCQGRSTRR